MTEEIKNESSPETPPEVQLSPVEQAAFQKGWRPKEEFDGDPERWRSAEVFLALDEPLKRIEHQSKEVKQLKEALQAFREHHTKVEASAFDRALKQLQLERAEARRDEDHARADEIADRIDEVKEQKRVLVEEAQKQVVREPASPAPEFVEWQSKNSWYQSDKAMTAVADAYGRELHAQGFTPAQVLKRVEEHVKEEFPNKFKKPAAGRPSPVEGGSRSGGSSSSNAGISLNETELEIMRKIVRTGAMTEAQYKAELKRVKEL